MAAAGAADDRLERRLVSQEGASDRRLPRSLQLTGAGPSALTPPDGLWDIKSRWLVRIAAEAAAATLGQDFVDTSPAFMDMSGPGPGLICTASTPE